MKRFIGAAAWLIWNVHSHEMAGTLSQCTPSNAQLLASFSVRVVKPLADAAVSASIQIAACGLPSDAALTAAAAPLLRHQRIHLRLKLVAVRARRGEELLADLR